MLLFFVGAHFVFILIVAFALRLCFRLGQWPFRYLFLFAYTISQLLAAGVGLPNIIFGGDGTYGDVYVPYCFVPGIHIYWFAAQLAKYGFHPLLTNCTPFWASIIVVVIIPGLFGGTAGGIQWYLIGSAVDRWSGLHSGEEMRRKSARNEGNWGRF